MRDSKVPGGIQAHSGEQLYTGLRWKDLPEDFIELVPLSAVFSIHTTYGN
jgi:hypothetical protein